MTDQEIKETLNKMGITKWTKWETRLKIGCNHIFSVMLLWCILAGLLAMGWIGFISSLLFFTLLEIITTVAKYTYCSIKRFIKRRK